MDGPQVGKQNAAEAQPLIFEPQSKFYVDPVLVLDFQSLYPSVMIGYNYCYSTCLGRVERFKGASKLGWMDMVLPPGELELLQNHVSSESSGCRAFPADSLDSLSEWTDLREAAPSS
jgi:DNA polymerase zeta